MSGDVEIFGGIYVVLEFKVICDREIEGNLPVGIGICHSAHHDLNRRLYAACIFASGKRNDRKNIRRAVFWIKFVYEVEVSGIARVCGFLHLLRQEKKLDKFCSCLKEPK